MSVDISVSITEDIVDIIATPTVNIVNVTNSASIDPGLYDLSEFTNTSGNPFVRTSGLSSYVPSTRILTINGVAQDLSTDRSWTISTGLTVGTTPISSGTIGRVLFQGTGNVLQQSSSLFWDSTNNRLGIGTSSPLYKLDLFEDVNNYSAIRVMSRNNSTAFFIGSTVDYPNTFWISKNNSAFYILTSGSLTLGTGAATTLTFNTDNSTRAQISSTGNFLIGTTTDAGFRLDVNGTARINTLTVGLGGGQQSTNTAVGVTALNANTTGVSNTAIGFEALLLNSTASGNTALGRRALRATTGASNIAIGNSAMENNTSGVANIGIGEGAGNVNTTGGSNIFIGNWSSGVVNNGVNRTWIGNSSTTSTYLAGNVLINTTTDAGYKLDVNGTARTKGGLYVGTTGSQASLYFENSSAVAGWRIYYGSSDLFFDKSGNQFTMYDNQGFYIRDKARIGGSAGFTASAVLDLVSTNKGFLPPRMTTTERNAIASPAAGLVIFDVTLNKLCVFTTTWETVTSL